MTEQVMGRVWRQESGQVICVLNSAGKELPDDTKLYAHPAVHKETDAESRTAWIAVVLQKCPTAEINVVGYAAIATTPAGTVVGKWTPDVWSVK